jgi:hypothetical protein
VSLPQSKQNLRFIVSRLHIYVAESDEAAKGMSVVFNEGTAEFAIEPIS